MKIASLVIGVAALLFAAIFSFDSDPFSARSMVSEVRVFSPAIAYAASSTTVDGYNAASHTQISWDAPVASSEDKEGEMVILCQNPSEALKSHPRYQDWCHQ
ncbi:MAG: hypothetical protein CL531_00195 [Aestuariibacter sp.]|nr:hypothetical protein [Aestuariibacter sp.]MCP4256060.1 hypothetical protein [Planctomycetota bacterium]|tara:strand:- start:784 stop:1089 length:306 start_codon:yes stop_codon:yes gene_type:complete